MEYSELVQRLFEKMTFFLVDPLPMLGGFLVVIADMALSMLVWLSVIGSSCSLTRQASGDQ
jgi:hypothetical protein